MAFFFRLAMTFFTFLRDELVPFFTQTPEALTVPILHPNLSGGLSIRLVSVPWFFGDTTFGEFILVGGLLFFVGYRFIKFFLDIIF